MSDFVIDSQTGEAMKVAVTSSSGYSLSYDTDAMVARETYTRDGKVVQQNEYPLVRRPEGWEPCRVYWGSHGCELERGHEGDCVCCCCCEGEHEGGGSCVGMAPYYGPRTTFYGEDVEARGLPTVAPPREPCGHCGAALEDDAPDPCLGLLPNVWGACCGHGDPERAYVAIRDGEALYGREATDYFKANPA